MAEEHVGRAKRQRQSFLSFTSSVGTEGKAATPEAPFSRTSFSSATKLTLG